MKITERKIENVSFITLNNEHGMNIILSTLGASIYQLEIADKHNHMESVILTPSSLNDFYYNDGYHGKIVGRFSGRIDEAKCVINDVTYNLDKNWNGINSLHGGNKGISFSNFDYKIKENNENVEVIFTLLEKEDLLPGDVNYTITYKISKTELDFTILFNATTNKDTIVNMTNHAYFNLSGDAKDTILNHKLKLNCPYYTNLNNNLITTSIDKVNKIMDFTKFKKIKKHINDESLINHTANGYDHCFIKENSKDDVIAILKDNKTKRKLTIKTSYPSIVVYTCNYPSDFDFNMNHIKISKHHGICLECQYVPNGINMDNVNKAILRKDEKYNEYINYHFDN